MITKLSEVVNISTFLKNWNGKQTNNILTSNSKIQKYHSTGEDCFVNVVIIKLLVQNDRSAFEKILHRGVSVFYQSSRFDITKKDNFIICQIYNKLNQDSGLVYIDDRSINIKKKFGISRNESVIISMFELDKFGVPRKINEQI